MDQKKIGMFIANLRKKKNLTQLELASKLGISDRTISKWENGRGMPDISLIRPLCEELDITINELLSGERITEEEYQEKLEENILHSIDYNDKQNKNHKKFKFVVSGILVGIFVIMSIFFIDITRMYNQEEVFFSTWGFDYYPPINLQDEEIEQTIKEYLIDKAEENKRYNNEKTFVSMNIYLIEEQTSIKPKTSLYYVYAWVLEETYYQNNNLVEQESGSSLAYKFEVQCVDEIYTVIDSRIPRDGSYYDNDMKVIFPSSVRRVMNKVHRDGTIERLSLDIDEQVKLYYHN